MAYKTNADLQTEVDKEKVPEKKHVYERKTKIRSMSLAGLLALVSFGIGGKAVFTDPVEKGKASVGMDEDDILRTKDNIRNSGIDVGIDMYEKLSPEQRVYLAELCEKVGVEDDGIIYKTDAGLQAIGNSNMHIVAGKIIDYFEETDNAEERWALGLLIAAIASLGIGFLVGKKQDKSQTEVHKDALVNLKNTLYELYKDAINNNSEFMDKLLTKRIDERIALLCQTYGVATNGVYDANEFPLKVYIVVQIQSLETEKKRILDDIEKNRTEQLKNIEKIKTNPALVTEADVKKHCGTLSIDTKQYEAQADTYLLSIQRTIDGNASIRDQQARIDQARIDAEEKEKLMQEARKLAFALNGSQYITDEHRKRLINFLAMIRDGVVHDNEIIVFKQQFDSLEEILGQTIADLDKQMSDINKVDIPTNQDMKDILTLHMEYMSYYGSVTKIDPSFELPDLDGQMGTACIDLIDLHGKKERLEKDKTTLTSAVNGGGGTLNLMDDNIIHILENDGKRLQEIESELEKISLAYTDICTKLLDLLAKFKGFIDTHTIGLIKKKGEDLENTKESHKQTIEQMYVIAEIWGRRNSQKEEVLNEIMSLVEGNSKNDYSQAKGILEEKTKEAEVCKVNINNIDITILKLESDSSTYEQKIKAMLDKLTELDGKTNRSDLLETGKIEQFLQDMLGEKINIGDLPDGVNKFADLLEETVIGDGGEKRLDLKSLHQSFVTQNSKIMLSPLKKIVFLKNLIECVKLKRIVDEQLNDNKNKRSALEKTLEEINQGILDQEKILETLTQELENEQTAKADIDKMRAALEKMVQEIVTKQGTTYQTKEEILAAFEQKMIEVFYDELKKGPNK